MKFPSPAFDDAVAAACHGTADEECLAALAAVLQTDEAALDTYLWRTELPPSMMAWIKAAAHLDAVRGTCGDRSARRRECIGQD